MLLKVRRARQIVICSAAGRDRFDWLAASTIAMNRKMTESNANDFLFSSIILLQLPCVARSESGPAQTARQVRREEVPDMTACARLLRNKSLALQQSTR